MVLAGRVLCVMMASASGHVILERFYDPISEPEQMRWRDRLHRAEASSGAGASTVAGIGLRQAGDQMRRGAPRG